MAVFSLQNNLNAVTIIFLIYINNCSITCAGDFEKQSTTVTPGHLEKLAARSPKHNVDEYDGFLPAYEFFSNYVGKHKPVVFKKAVIESNAFKLWTDEYLMSLPESAVSEVEVEQGKKENRSNPGLRMSFKEFLQVYKEQNIYLVNRVLSFLEKDVMMPRSLLCEGVLDKYVDTVMWFSSGGTKSVLHNDDQENINCLYRGTKELLFIDYKKYKSKVDIDFPVGGYSGVDVDKVNFTKYPGLQEVEYHYVKMEAGDCLYIPYKWFHQVTSHGNNLAINVWWKHQSTLPTKEQCDLASSYPPGVTIDQFKFDTSEENPYGSEQSQSDPIEHFLSYLQGVKSLTYEEFEKKIREDDVIHGEGKYLWNDEFAAVAQDVFHSLDQNKDALLTAGDIDFTNEEVRRQLDNHLARLEDLIEDQSEEYLLGKEKDEQITKDEL